MINIAELLKDCPKGTKLYSPLFGEVFLYTILSESKFITVRTADSITTFNEFGQWGDNSRWERFPDAECLLFPSKEVRTWEGWKAPVQPKFKVGDNIKIGNIIETIAEVANAIRKYYCESGRIISFENQDLWYLVPKPHYDIKNFKPKQWVLVRDDDEWEWALTRFSYLSNGSASLFVCINGASFQQCIPFEGNEHLLGTTDMPSEEYINW